MKTKKQKTKKNNKNLALDLAVRDAKGRKINTVSLNKKVFNGEVNAPLLHQAITMYRANQRSGSASTKNRAQVRGGGKKPWRQKGTGRARTGSIRNPLWRGGGVIFGPRPRDFSYSVPQKIKRRALMSSLNEKLLNNNFIIINQLNLDKPKTKSFFCILKSLGVSKGQSAIVILEKLDKNVKLASRNIPKISVKAVDNLNALDILKHQKLIIQQATLDNLTRNLK